MPIRKQAASEISRVCCGVMGQDSVSWRIVALTMLSQHMPKSQPQVDEPKRPKLRELLSHLILENDNGPQPSDLHLPPQPVGSPGLPDYDDWLLDHAGRARFYLGGFRSFRAITREGDARHYAKFSSEAKELASSCGWTREEKGGNWNEPISYNQYRKAIILQEPMFFELAALVSLSCECALAATIDANEYSGSRFDVYRMIKIIPACYNIDEFNRSGLVELRRRISNYDDAVLVYAGQRRPHLLELLTQGNCVTRRTARAIRWKTLELMHAHGITSIPIGDVRGRPGRRRLGRKNATVVEDLELDNITRHT